MRFQIDLVYWKAYIYTWVHSHAIRSHKGTNVVFPDFQPMRVSEEPVCICLFRHNPVFTSLQLRSSVHVVPPQRPEGKQGRKLVLIEFGWWGGELLGGNFWRVMREAATSPAAYNWCQGAVSCSVGLAPCRLSMFPVMPEFCVHL